VTPGLSDDTTTAVESAELEPGERVITRIQSDAQQAEGWSLFPRGGGGRGRR
jgi:hypothetical protein